MRQVLQQLAGIQGVVGALACDEGGALLEAAFPPLFDEQALRQVAGLFGDGALRALTGEGGAAELRFARGRAYLRPYQGGTLVVIGTAATDRQLLGLSLARAAQRLEQAAGPAASTATAVPAAAPVAAPEPAKPAAVPPEVERLRAPLREALIRQIGPFGDVAFEEQWAAWTVAGAPERRRLRLLVDGLATEVDDGEARLAFFVEACALIM